MLRRMLPTLNASDIFTWMDSPDDSTQFRLDIGANSDDEVETMQRCDSAPERPCSKCLDMDVQRSNSSGSRGKMNSTNSSSMRRNMTTLNLLVDDSEGEEDLVEAMDPRQFVMDTFRRSGSLQVPSP